MAKTTHPRGTRAPTVAVAIFNDVAATRVEARRLTPAAIERLIRDTKPVARKEAARLLKLAEFGDAPSAKGSLRHDANVTAISGVIADYDGGVMTIAEAAQRLRAHGLAAVLYTTASHTAELPRWRAITFLSEPLTGTTEELKDTHRHWTGVLNAILGGALKSESFTLSQSYYFGPIAGKPEPEVLRLSGAAIDAIANPPDPIYPQTWKKVNGADTEHQHDTSRSGELFTRIGDVIALGWDDARIHEEFDDHPHAADQPDPQRAVQRCIDKHRQRRPAFAEEDWAAPAVVAYDASFDPAAIPLRRWLLGNRRAIGEVTADAGPPGVNKSMLMLTDSVAIATGRRLLADHPHERGGVLFLAGEDARRDVEARLAAILAHYKIAPAELGGRLRCVYLSEINARVYTLAEMARDVAALNSRMFEWLADYPDTVAVFIDPIATWHRLVENSNEAMALLCASLRSVAVQGQRHVGFDHHITKVSMVDSEAHVGNLAAVRGAGAITASVRWAFTVARINPETAMKLAIPEPERRVYRRLDSLKASYGPDDERARILRVTSVQIDNGEVVGVLTEIDADRLREVAEAGLAKAADEWRTAFTKALAQMLNEARPRSVNAAADWLVGHHPELFPSKAKGQIDKTVGANTVRSMLPKLIGTGLASAKGQRIVYASGTGKTSPGKIDFEGAR